MTHAGQGVSGHALREQLEAAISEVTAAEHALDEVLSQLRVGTRAEKVTISAALENAFTRLRSSREALAKLRDLVDATP